jgi:hypothetical protein
MSGSANYSSAFMLWGKNQQKAGIGRQKYERSSSCRFNGLRYQQGGQLQGGRIAGMKRVVAYGMGKW